METRDLSLSPRVENVREMLPLSVPVQFTLNEIYHHFTESLEAIRNQYEVADSLKANGNLEGCKTVWRSQIVLSEGLLDFFIHEISKYCLFRMFTGQWAKSEKYASFSVPMAKVEEAIMAVESKTWFFNYLNSRFSRDVFLASEIMKDQLNLIGVPYKDVMLRAFASAGEKEQDTIKRGNKIVTELFQRRNAIAHQNDRSHESAEQTDISKDYVEDYIKKIELIIEAIRTVAIEKDTSAQTAEDTENPVDK